MRAYRGITVQADTWEKLYHLKIDTKKKSLNDVIMFLYALYQESVRGANNDNTNDETSNQI